MADPTIDTINAMTAQLRAASVLLAELSADVASLREQLPRGGGGAYKPSRNFRTC